MTESPMVSVCVPTFNGDRFLEEALASAESQSFEDIEMIVSDSGSSDETVDIIDAYRRQSRFPFRVLSPPPPGMVENWNHCIRHAKGKYIKFLFQDDLLDPDCVKEMVDLAEADYGIGMVFSARHILLSNEAQQNPFCREIAIKSNEVHLAWTNLQTVQCGRDLLYDSSIVKDPFNKVGEPSVVLLRRDVVNQVGGFKTSLRQVVDLEMWWRMMSSSKVGFISKPLATFRIHERQASAGNTNPLQVTAELKQFGEIVLGQRYASDFPEETRQFLQKMADKNLLVESLRLQYRRPVTWLRDLLGLSEGESWKSWLRGKFA